MTAHMLLHPPCSLPLESLSQPCHCRLARLMLRPRRTVSASFRVRRSCHFTRRLVCCFRPTTASCSLITPLSTTLLPFSLLVHRFTVSHFPALVNFFTTSVTAWSAPPAVYIKYLFPISGLSALSAILNRATQFNLPSQPLGLDHLKNASRSSIYLYRHMFYLPSTFCG